MAIGMLALAAAHSAWGGTFLFAIASSQTRGTPDQVAHALGYDGTGGTLEIKVCVDAASPSAADLEVPILNAIDRLNRRVPIIGNLRFGEDTDLAPGSFDIESTAVHELGHCLGLAHPNMAAESGLIGVGEGNWNYTKATRGGNRELDFGFGADLVRGSPDDVRGDDVNFHWFETGVNDPFRVPLRDDIDAGSYTVLPGDLPSGDLWIANGDRTVAETAYGLAATEVVMQQGQNPEEVQRGLGADDAATLALARAGLDRISGTADDYDVEVVYVGIRAIPEEPPEDEPPECDLYVGLSESTSFAACFTNGQELVPGHFAITSAAIRFADDVNWDFPTFRLPTPAPDELVLGPGGTATTLASGEPSLLANDTHPDELPLLVDRARTYGGPAHGSVVLAEDGTFSYTHACDGSTMDEFVYRSCVAGREMCDYQVVSVAIEGEPAVTLTLAAAAPAPSVAEPGGSTQIELTLENDSPDACAVDITALLDDQAGSLDGLGTCALPVTLLPGESYACAYEGQIIGNAGDSTPRTITATAVSNAMELAPASDAVTLMVSDVPPAGAATTTVTPAVIPAAGASVTRTVEVTNDSVVEPLDLTALRDDLAGSLDGRGSCALPVTLAPGESYACAYETTVDEPSPGRRTIRVEATLADDDGGSVAAVGETLLLIDFMFSDDFEASLE